jgi:hypothetical protein
MNKSHHALSWMCFCGYFTWSNGSHCEVILIILILGVIFTQSVYLTPWHDCMKAPILFCHSFWRDLIMLCPECVFVVTLLDQTIQIVKLFAYYQYMRSFLGIWTPGVIIYGVSHTVLPLILKNPIMLWPECRLWWLCIIKWFKLSSYLPNTYSRGPFWLNFGHLIPHIYVPINIIIRRCCAIIFNEIPHALP